MGSKVIFFSLETQLFIFFETISTLFGTGTLRKKNLFSMEILSKKNKLKKKQICQVIFLLCRAADSDIQLMKISLTEYLLSITSRKSKIPHVWRNPFCVWRKISTSNFFKSFKLITQGCKSRPPGQDFKTFG